jgi:predicted transcriptional regulator
MSNTITVRLPADLAEWLSEVARETGVPVGRIVREQLQTAKNQRDERPYMRLAGKLKGLPRDLSTRKGYSRK